MMFLEALGEAGLYIFIALHVGLFALLAKIANLFGQPSRPRVPLIERYRLRIGRVVMRGLRIGRLYLSLRWGTLCILGPHRGRMIQRAVSFGISRWGFIIIRRRRSRIDHRFDDFPF